jgi:hypothetical protein
MRIALRSWHRWWTLVKKKSGQRRIGRARNRTVPCWQWASASHLLSMPRLKRVKTLSALGPDLKGRLEPEWQSAGGLWIIPPPSRLPLRHGSCNRSTANRLRHSDVTEIHGIQARMSMSPSYPHHEGRRNVADDLPRNGGKVLALPLPFGLGVVSAIRPWPEVWRAGTRKPTGICNRRAALGVIDRECSSSRVVAQIGRRRCLAGTSRTDVAFQDANK